MSHHQYTTGRRGSVVHTRAAKHPTSSSPHVKLDASVPVNRPTYHRQDIVSSAQVHPARQAGQQPQQVQHQYHHKQPNPLQPFHSTAAPTAPQKQLNGAAKSTVTTLLPYCTAEAPLSEEQVIAVTDVAGSLKELVLVALGAKKGDEECLSRLMGVLGDERMVAGIVDFFSDEFEVG